MEELNGPECLWGDGEHEPEGDPEERIGRVAGEVEEKRFQKMQVLEKPEGSRKGISYLTTRNVYDWRKKPYQLGDGISIKRWKRRSRLVAGKLLLLKEREMTFSHQRHVLKPLPAIFSQRISEEDEAREGAGAFSQVLGCLDVKDAFLQVPQEKPLKVNLTREELLVRRNILGQRVGAKAWFCFFTEYLTAEFNYKFSPQCPRLGRNEKRIIWAHVDDLIFTGDSKYIYEIPSPKVQGKFDASVSKIEIGNEFNPKQFCSKPFFCRWVESEGAMFELELFCLLAFGSGVLCGCLVAMMTRARNHGRKMKTSDLQEQK